MTSIAIAAYLTLFAAVGFAFVWASLMLGRFLRASEPTPQKQETYECGEPAVGPSSVRFDLRFYVVALVFLIFEVEVAFLFPPATIFGQAVQATAVANKPAAAACGDGDCRKTAANSGPTTGLVEIATDGQASPPAGATAYPTLAKAAMLDMGVFFAVLLVGFAYVWRRGDLDWVRAVRHSTPPLERANAALQLRSDAQR